jgi:two-component system response regulator HydG
MPLATQAKLLRVLETREVVQVGGNTSRKVDIRLVAATNRDLEAMVAEGTFREDLFHRLQVVAIELPPLRYRVSDLPFLVDHFIAEFGRTHARRVTGITPEARAVLSRYPWPGNVRELRNTIENMVLLTRGDVLAVDDLPDRVRRVVLGSDAAGRDGRDAAGARHAGEHGGGAHGSGELGAGEYSLVGRPIADVERDMIRVNLEHYEGNRKRTAEALGIGERTLYRKIKEYGL